MGSYSVNKRCNVGFPRDTGSAQMGYFFIKRNVGNSGSWHPWVIQLGGWFSGRNMVHHWWTQIGQWVDFVRAAPYHHYGCIGLHLLEVSMGYQELQVVRADGLEGAQVGVCYGLATCNVQPVWWGNYGWVIRGQVGGHAAWLCPQLGALDSHG
ncbi:hypothetical protein E3N88_07532 [Mikania micrantha]|uniref:Uncharacterized protein n=1 Tax=Mikania micrantha TaxID=192012 RepID=A0A5N6PT68_9ASTR|nr:hypothetical protein E3N88_07532 [Mikania micrantha]